MSDLLDTLNIEHYRGIKEPSIRERFKMFWKKKDKSQWSDFKPLKHCNECGRLQLLEIGDFFNDNCPRCGSTDITKVIARWRYTFKTNPTVRPVGEYTYHEYEIKEIENFSLRNELLSEGWTPPPDQRELN